MKNIGLIFAGGTGTRLNSRSLPKQFLVMGGKPVIIHTLEYFESCSLIDSVCVVCLEEKIGYLKQLLERFGITKVNIIVPGGATGQDSIYNGLDAAIRRDDSPEDTVVLIHDGVRPLISVKTIEDCIACARENGNAVTVTRAYETIMTKGEDGTITGLIDRTNSLLVRAPQAYFLSDIYAAHQRARAEGYTGAIDSATLMNHYGCALHPVDGPAENIKITTASDYFMARSILDARENSQLFDL